MSERKQTPDILAEILGGEATSPVASDVEVDRPLLAKPPAAPKRAAPSRRPAPAKPDASAARSAKGWQLHVASFQERNGWRLRYVDGKEVADWLSSPLLHEYIALQAAEGWQVAAACSGQTMFGVADKYQVFLQRPS
jgi:hypothetical protein